MGKQLTNEEFLEKLKKNNAFYREGEFKVLEPYKNALSKILVETKYGKCLVEANSLTKGYAPTITSAVDKNIYCINLIKEVHGNLYDYKDLVFNSMKKKVKLTCNRHGKITMTPSELVKGSRCRKCAFELNTFKLEDWKKVKPGNNAILYLIKCFNENEEFYKIGITSLSVEERYKTVSRMPYNFDIIFSFTYYNRDIIWELEKDIKKFIMPYSPLIKFKGYLTECFDKTYIENVLYMLKSYENYQVEKWKELETSN
jgi:hypothetical protein